MFKNQKIINIYNVQIKYNLKWLNLNKNFLNLKIF